MELMNAFRALLFIALISTVSSAQVPQIIETPAWPENPPESWLTYHLAHPGPGAATPGDPNPAFFWNGRYHLHYIYRNHTGFVFANVSSEGFGKQPHADTLRDFRGRGRKGVRGHLAQVAMKVDSPAEVVELAFDEVVAPEFVAVAREIEHQ